MTKPTAASAVTPKKSGKDSIDLARIVESARRLGMELDVPDTLQWLAALKVEPDAVTGDIVIDAAAGTFGHRVSMLDFSPRDLERFRLIGTIVEVTGSDDRVESALALSGSAAQSKIQSFPGDCDYFQRLNLKTPTREEACQLMADLMREKVLTTDRGETYQFLEAKLGSASDGRPLTWKFADIDAKVLHDGDDVYHWDEVALDPGWCKLDWVVTDPQRTQLSNASNVIDVTWESPTGEIVPLDGYLDAFFQEVYLDSDDLEMFEKVTSFVTDDALDEYVDRIEGEVRKYLTDHLNYGKAAKRMYNVFRLSGRYYDAAFVRELFDEPATVLYQVGALIVTLDNATQPGSAIPIDAVRSQADALVLDVMDALEGDERREIVAALMHLSRTLESQSDATERTAEVEAAQTQVVNLVNTFYRDRLVAMPSIKEYIDTIQAEGTAA